MDQVVNHSGMVSVLFPEFFQYACSLNLLRQARVVRRGVTSSQHRERIEGLHFEIVRMLITELAHCFFIGDNPIARSDGSVTRLSNRSCARAVRRVVIGVECSNESALAIRAGVHRHRLFNGCFACAHFVRSGRRPDWMPPRHGDSPLRHRAFRVAFGHRSKNASSLFVEKRVKQCYATSEIRLDLRRARYWEGNFPDAAQIARFGRGRTFGVAQDKQSTDKRDETNRASRTRSQHSQGYLPITIPANCKIISATGKGSSFSAKGAILLQPGASPQEFNRI